MWRLRYAGSRPLSESSYSSLSASAHLLLNSRTNHLTPKLITCAQRVVTHSNALITQAISHTPNCIRSSRCFTSSAADTTSAVPYPAEAKENKTEQANREPTEEDEEVDPFLQTNDLEDWSSPSQAPVNTHGSMDPSQVRQYYSAPAELSPRERLFNPLEPLHSQMLPMEVVMAPGDSHPRMPFPTRADSNPVIDSMLVKPPVDKKAEADAERQAKANAQPWPTLGPIRKLASGLLPTLGVKGIVRVGEDLNELREEINTRGAHLSKPAPAAAAPASTTESSVLPPAWTARFATDFERITHPHLVDLSSTAGFTTSSRDALLLRLATSFQCNVMGSTSSTTKILTQFIFALGNFHPIQTKGILSPEFETLPKRASSAERAPSTMLFRRRREGAEVLKDVESEEHERKVRRKYLVKSRERVSDANLMGTATVFDSLPGVWAIDSVPSWSNPTNRILMELGHTLEAYFTHEPAEFQRTFLAKAKERLAQLEETVKQNSPPVPPGTPKSNPAVAAVLANAAAKLAESRAEKSAASATDTQRKTLTKTKNKESLETEMSVTKETEKKEPVTEKETEKDVRDAFLFLKMGNIMFRSQLDCWDPRLKHREELQSFVQRKPNFSQPTTTPTIPNWPGWEYGGLVFDIKTRAVLPIRIFCRRYSDFLDYNVLSLRGLLYSFEREYYDMQRAAFMKYSLQCRIGRMGGVMVGYHNTAKLYGYHFLSVKEMDESLFGHTLIGEWMFEQSTKLMNKYLASTEPDSIIHSVEEAHRRNWMRQIGWLNPLQQSEHTLEKAVRGNASNKSSSDNKTNLTKLRADTSIKTIPELSTMKCTISCFENDNSGNVNVYIELLPPAEENDPEAYKPFVQRYTSQRRVDSLPNYKIRRYLKELKLSPEGNRVAITSRLESALSVRPLEELPPLAVFESLAQQNLIHKFVIQVKVSDVPGGERDPTGAQALSPSDINTVLQKWSEEYRRMDEAHASKIGFVNYNSEPSDDSEQNGSGLNGERGPSTHGIPLSPESLTMRLQNVLGVSSSITRFSVEDGTISPSTLARQYYSALKIGRLSDDHENEGDMVKLLQVTLKTLVESRVKYEEKREQRKNVERKKREEAIKKLQAEEDNAELANAEAQRMLSAKGPQMEAEAEAEAEEEDEEDLENESAKDSTLDTKKTSTSVSASQTPKRSLLSTYSRLFKTARALKQDAK